MRAALALLAAAPAAAQDSPEWVGLWEGRVSNLPVRLCLESQGEGPGRGSYYYLSRLEPIALSEEGEEGGWIERAPGSEAEANWDFAELNGTRMRGTWRQGRRILPFELHPVPWSEGDWGGPCSSAEYVRPHLAGGSVAARAAALEGWGYTEHRFRPPPHLAEDVAVVTFSFPAAQPGDAAIAAALGAYLPGGTIGDDVYECLAGALSASGTDGFFEHELAPAMASRAFLVVVESSSTYCGGAHPDYWVVDRTFDRRTGEELDLFDWIGDARIDGEDSGLPAALRSAIVARWPADSDSECRELAAEADYWSLGLARDGLVFRPDFPHAMTACEEAVTVEWPALAPFLDADGKAGLARLRGG